MSTLYTAPGVSSSNLHKALNPHSPVAVGLLAFQQAFHFEARCRELRKRGSILRDSRRCGNPFFQLFLKDGTSSTGLLRPCSHGICYFPCSALGMLLLGTVGRTKNPSERSLLSAWCCFGSIEDTATPPIYRLSTMHPKTNRGKAFAFPRLHAHEVVSSRTAVRS